MNKKFILPAFFVLLLLVPPTQAQTQSKLDSILISNLADTLTDLYKRYFAIQENSESEQQRFRNVLTVLEDKLKLLENQALGNSEQIEQITSEDLRTKKTIYEKNRLGIIATANYMDAVNDGLNALEFTVNSLDYSTSIFALNNPTNTDLGFSLEESILQIVDQKIIKGKFGTKFGGKLRSILSGIINNPIINNPITKAITSTVPAVSSITSVFNVVNSVALGQRDINQQALNDFNTELQKYVAHYEALAKASQELDFNLASLRLKTASVRGLALNFVKESLTDLYTPEEVPNLEGLDMNTIIQKYYTYARVSQYVQNLERTHQYDYDYLSQRVIFPVVGRSKVSFIYEEIGKLYSDYVTTLTSYHKTIQEILQNAIKLSKEPKKVAQKTEDLNQRFEALLKSYQKNVDMENIKALVDNIPRF